MADPSQLGDRLRARRIAQQKTLAEVAERAGLSLPYVSNLERGRGNPTMEALRQLAGALGTTVGALVGEAGEQVDPLELVLAQAPASLTAFSRSTRFKETVDRLAEARGEDPDQLRTRILVGMASAPRRSSGEPTEDDWRRLVDVYSLILREE